VTVRYRTEVIDGSGDGQLTTLTLRDRSTGALETVATGGLFLLIGAESHTSWLPTSIQRDDRGYLVTGADLLTSSQLSFPWHLPRPPLPFETSMPGVFAVGDVQHGGVKRVAVAVCDGSVAIRLLHEYLAPAGRPPSV
jgi:thioredoxin reductase (NADPH)